MPETAKEGQAGTLDDNGFVPDSVEITKAEYDLLNPFVTPIPTQLETDISNLTIASVGEIGTKIKPILERIRNGER